MSASTWLHGFADPEYRITWHNVTLSFSFTPKEIQQDPWTKLRGQLEQLDIKYTADFDVNAVTHVISKKRNTAKCLQGLIYAKHITTDSFIDAILQAAETPESEDDSEKSALENDFDNAWPNPLDHLPPRGKDEESPDISFAPNHQRKEIFDGYTFIFCNGKQYENLVSPITSGKGKALLREVLAGETRTDDFVRYVKEVAGEKGLGEFEDGSEGKGVVVVRYLPSSGDRNWYADFTTTVSLQLDHRMIDQREFLDAILTLEPGNLRRPLETETAAAPDMNLLAPVPTPLPPPTQMVLDEQPPVAPDVVEEQPRPPPVRRSRPRRGITSRFKGFDVDMDADDGPVVDPPPPTVPAAVQEESMFVSQRQASEERQTASNPPRGSQRKRPAAELEEDIMEKLAPTAAALKRRRIAAGEDPFPSTAPETIAEEDAVPEMTERTTTRGQRGKKKKINENEILELAQQRREDAEKRQAEEKERLNELPEDGIDFEQIRNLTIVEDFEVRRPAEPRTREQDIADGRWDPSWNGRRNFKKFRKQGQPAGRAAQRVIITLEPVKTKQYGMGDDYWLEDTGSQRKKKKGDSSRQSQPSQPTESRARPGSRGKGKAPSGNLPVMRAINDVEESDSDDAEGNTLDENPFVEPDLPRTRVGKATERTAARQSQALAQTQIEPQTQRSGKRAAAVSPPKSKPTKRARRAIQIDDSDDSDDELKFRFGKR